MKNKKCRGSFPTGVAINAPAAFLLGCFVASSVPARASPECRTIAEARAAFPNKHLWWSYRDGARCWHDNAPVRSTMRRPVSHARPAPAPRPSVLWPVLAGAEPPIAAALFYPGAMTRWPVLVDIDADPAPIADASGNDVTRDVCCWPPLEPPFAERWYAMPASWFQYGGRHNGG